ADVVIAPLRSERGMPSAFSCHARDLSRELALDERNARERELSDVAATRAALSPDGLTLSALLSRVAARARELTGADAGVIELRDGHDERARAHSGSPHFDLELGSILMPYDTRSRGRVQCFRYDDTHES